MALFCFGDSYTEGYKKDPTFPSYKNYKDYLGLNSVEELPPTWSELLGKKLNTPVFNYGNGGSSNLEIFFKFCEMCSFIKSSDTVIINWTIIQRCLWDLENHNPDDEDYNLTSVNPLQADLYDKRGKYKTAFDLIAENRSTFQWTWEVIRYEEIIDELSKSVGFDVYYWYTDDYLFDNLSKLKNVNQRKYILSDLINSYEEDTDGSYNFCCIPFNIFKPYGATTISQEVGDDEDHMHLSGKGHSVQADFFYSYIMNLPYPKLKNNII